MEDKKEKLKLRDLEIDDLELILEIIDSIGIEEFTDCFKNLKIGKDNKIDVKQVGLDVGFKIIGKIIKNAKKCLNPLYQLIARLSDSDIEEAKKMNLFAVSGALFELSKREDFKDFLKLVSSLKN